MLRLRDMVEKVAITDANVLITGKNETGKDMLSNEIHNLSPRRDNIFVVIDMGAMSESLFESEFFGHIKGEFTDARIDRIGKIKVSDMGTLFLNEIGNLPIQRIWNRFKFINANYAPAWRITISQKIKRGLHSICY